MGQNFNEQSGTKLVTFFSTILKTNASIWMELQPTLVKFSFAFVLPVLSHFDKQIEDSRTKMNS